jgi:peptidyl-prolyl cis-trans isomerase D
MLDSLRKHATGWVAQIFIALLVLSFAIWGIADIFSGFNAGEIARVGNTPVTVTEFQRAYNNQLQAFSRQIGQPITPEQARSMGLPGQVLGQLVSQASVADQAQDLGLGISQEKLSAIITSDPLFNSGGGFSRTNFNQLLRANGLTETDYIAARRRDELRVQLVEAISGEIPAPETYQRALDEYRSETRTVNYIVVDGDTVADPGTPSDTGLTEYFAANRATWRAPEYRALTILRVEPSDLSRPEDISDEEARAVYDQRGSAFSEPERRRVSQVIFGDRTEADAAAERIAGGATLEEIAAERELPESEYQLGLITREELIDPSVAEAAFALESGATSAVVDGRFGAVIVKVDEIVAEVVQPYEEVVDAIKQDLADRRAAADILDEHDRIEDGRAGGSSLREIAAQFNLPLIEIEAVDAQGSDPEGNEIEDLPGGLRLVRDAFDSDVGIENDPIQTSNGGFVWYDVAEVKPARERDLSEVRDQVVEAWRQDQIAGELQEEAETIAEEVRAGGVMADVAAVRGLQIQLAGEVTRAGSALSTLPSEALPAAFSGPAGTVSVAAGEERYFVVEVVEVDIPEFSPGGLGTQALAQQMSQSLGNDLLQQYLTDLQTSLGVTVNQATVQLIVGGSAL